MVLGCVSLKKNVSSVQAVDLIGPGEIQPLSFFFPSDSCLFRPTTIRCSQFFQSFRPRPCMVRGIQIGIGLAAGRMVNAGMMEYMEYHRSFPHEPYLNSTCLKGGITACWWEMLRRALHLEITAAAVTDRCACGIRSSFHGNSIHVFISYV